MRVAGLVLAAGGGSRLAASLGEPGALAPKALVTGPDGETWVARVVATLADGGCRPVLVVAGAAADRVADALQDTDTRIVVAADWASGLGASLRAGLAALGDEQAVLVALVDVPELPAGVVSRLLAHADDTALIRAGYGGRPGHPVLLGRAHWAAARQSAAGDQGARALLRGAALVECGDLAAGTDVDVADDLPAGHTVTLLPRPAGLPTLGLAGGEPA